jgi:hypothetical protein
MTAGTADPEPTVPGSPDSRLIARGLSAEPVTVQPPHLATYPDVSRPIPTGYGASREPGKAMRPAGGPTGELTPPPRDPFAWAHQEVPTGCAQCGRALTDDGLCTGEDKHYLTGQGAGVTATAAPPHARTPGPQPPLVPDCHCGTPLLTVVQQQRGECNRCWTRDDATRKRAS